MGINDEAVQRFGERIGLPHLRLDADRTCALTVGDGLDITFEDAGTDGQLRVNGKVGFVPHADPELWRSLLVANYNGQATGPATLSVDPTSGEVVLGQTLATGHLDGAGFAAAIETFLRYLSFWVDHLPTMRPATAAPADLPLQEMMIRI